MLSAVAWKVFPGMWRLGWAGAAGDTSDDEAMACPIAPAIDKLPTVVRTCLRLWPSFPLDIEHSCFMTSSVAQGIYGVCDTPEIAAKIAARIRTFVPSDRLLFLPSDFIRDRVQEIGRCLADETEARSLSGPGDAVDVPATVLGHKGISVDRHPPDHHGHAFPLPTSIHPPAHRPTGG